MLMHHVMKIVSAVLQTQHHVSWYQSLSNVNKLVTMEAQALFDSSTSTCFMDKELMQPYKLVIMEKNTLVPIEVIDDRNLSLGPITHATKPLNVTIGCHTNKVVFNVISSPKNLVVIGLFCLFDRIHK
jgi:hypothetical protein